MIKKNNNKVVAKKTKRNTMQWMKYALKYTPKNLIYLDVNEE